jgi:hypothetical protein
MYDLKRYNFIKDLHKTPENSYLFSFENPSVLYHKVPHEFMDIIISEIDKIKQNDTDVEKFNDKLAGHLKKEYSLKPVIPAINNYIMTLANNYAQANDITDLMNVLTEDVPFVLNDIWVNLQSKHEFNPIHDHSGVLSFVIWVKIPYDLQEEFAVFPKMKKKENHTSTFNFVFTDILGRIQTEALPIDKSFEGIICIFPSKLKHLVNPFYTSDEERISVSGNIKLNPEKVVK